MAWRIKYSNHLRQRIEIRELPYDMAKDILIYATERYYDTSTHNLIAIGQGELKNKIREFAVSYKEDWQTKTIEVVTIHPLKYKQKENRLRTRRWIIR